MKIPKEILNLHGGVFLTLDIFFVNKIPFLLTLSRKICYTTVQHLGGRTVSEIFQSFKAVYQHYIRRGFRIITVHADGEFAPLAATQRQTILESHMFLKEKRDGSIKGRTVAGGNKQWDYISKEDASSPTVATESVLLTCIIDAEEGRDVAVINIPNAFIQTRIEDEKDMATIKLRGVLVDILVALAPTCTSHTPPRTKRV
jgi:hypothetical protein